MGRILIINGWVADSWKTLGTGRRHLGDDQPPILLLGQPD